MSTYQHHIYNIYNLYSQAYIAWVNSQLRKRPGLAPVQDLRTDLQSGETLAHLIEIICEYPVNSSAFVTCIL